MGKDEPAVVALEAPHAVEVTKHACYDPGNTCNGFEEDVSEITWWSVNTHHYRG